jgi:glycosyltransferase involved in cell wall biosynthesis
MSSSQWVDFLFSNDGSTDDTAKIVEEFKKKYPERIKVFTLQQNSGKAEAVRQGMLEAYKDEGYSHIGFWDADLATPLTEIVHLLAFSSRKKIMLGSRWKRLGAVIERKGSRHLLGRVFSTFASIILKMPVYDTQCGAKIFTREVIFLLDEKFITKWLFDIELLARYRNKFGHQAAVNDIIEVPIDQWMEKGGSKLKLTHMLGVPAELLKINSKYN